MTVKRRLKVMNFGAAAMNGEPTVKVAFASGDLRHVDQHFGAAESFSTYQLDPLRSSLVEVIQFGLLAMDGNEDKLAAKIAALEGCVAVYCQAVGASAVKQLRAKGIQPIKVCSGTPISHLIETLQEELRAGPDTWLARAIEARQPADPYRFDRMEAEGWSE